MYCELVAGGGPCAITSERDTDHRFPRDRKDMVSHVRRHRFLLVGLACAVAAVLAVAFHYALAQFHAIRRYELAEDLAFFALSGTLVGVVVWLWLRDADRSAEALRESESRYRSLVGSMEDFVFTLDAEQCFSGIFGRWTRDQQIDPHMLIGKTAEEVFGDEFESRHAAAFLRVMSGTHAEYEWSSRLNGLTRYFHTSMSPLRDQSEAVVGAVGVTRDVTEKTVLDDAYHETNELLHAVIAGSPVAIFTLDEHGRIRSANSAAERILAKPQAQLLGEMLVRPADSLEIASRLRECAVSGESFTSLEVVRARDDGSHVVLGISAAPLNGRHGRARYVVALASDLTARRRRQSFERLLHEIDRRILRNEPLDAILAFTCSELAEQYGDAHVQISLSNDDGGVTLRAGHESPETLGFRRTISIPLEAKDQIVGALTLFTLSDDVIDAETQNLLFAFADQIAFSFLAARDQEQIALQTVALESAANAVVVTDVEGTIRWVNPALERLTGFKAEEVIGRKPSLFKSGNHSATFYRQMWETLQQGMVWSGELWNRRKDGTLYVEEQTITPVRASDGRITQFVAIKQDVTARRRHEEQIRHLAMHDPLTDLPNRRALDGAMERLCWDARRGAPGALMILDVDNFKPVNDTLGHIGGDQLLAELAKLLRRTLRPTDFLARLGGDEFAVLLQDTSIEGAAQVGERIRNVVATTPFRFGDRVFDLTISVGIAPVDASTDGSGAMVHADSAMYAAKDAGKNRIIAYPFGEEAGLRLIEASRWASRIRNALRDGRFALRYQPVIRLGNGEPEHYEALVRMIDVDGTSIPPEEFISAGERFGLMPQIDRWVVDNVLKMLTHRAFDARVFVNISGASLGDRDLLAYIEGRIVEERIPAGTLAFEITESAAIRDITIAQSWIRKLKTLGCLFAIDDFGVGFSSFAYLRALSADYVKIDRSFVTDVDTNPTNRALVQAVMTVAQTLGKEVIAEGVETDEHARVLIELGIELAQGFRWGVPQTDLFAVA